MEKVISKIAALGIPGLILVTAMGATGLSGAACLTAALASLGPGGMLGGLAFLGVVGLLSQSISEFGFNAIFTGVVKTLYKNGETKDIILKKRKISCFKIVKKKT